MVSPYDTEGYQHDYDLLVNKGPRTSKCGRHRPYERHLFRRFANADCFIKTISDPQNSLSKKQRKRILADKSDGFCADVPYSKNKRKMWETMNSRSLLRNHHEYDYGTCVVNHELTSPALYSFSHSTSVTRMQILDDNSLMTLSSGGRGKAIKYFNKRLADIHELSHDTVPPRIHLNIFTPTRVSRFNHHYYFKTYENWCLALWRKGKQHDAVEIITDDYDLQSEDSDTENPTGLDATGSSQSYRNVTLEDFINHKQSMPCRRHKRNLHRRRRRTSLEEVTGNSQTPAPLLDISKVVNSHHIFEIVDVNLANVDSFNLQEEVALVLPAYCTSQWFGDERVSVRSKPTDKPFFVLFFETQKEQQKLRIRINTNTPYSNTARRESLLETLQTSRNFGSLFTDLIEFIFKTVQKEPKQESSRFQKVREAFLPANNSEMLASKAQRCSELDKVKYIEPYYNLNDYEVIFRTQEDPVICYQCKSTYHTDLFLTMDGMACRQCIASCIMHQLRLSLFPIEIPLLPPNGRPLDLLHALLPVPLVSLVIEMSYNCLYKAEHPDALFTQCPQCLTSLTLAQQNEYNICQCPECECCWCYHCCWEPHWPMTCKEFEEWNKKWDEQYFFEKFSLGKGERLLSITCCCDNIFYVPEYSAHGAACPARNCSATYDKRGLMRCRFRFNSSLRWLFRRKQHFHCEKEHDLQVTPKPLEPKKLIRKEVASICVAARIERFYTSMRLEFENSVAKSTCSEREQCQVKDLRKTILFLVENCTAWIYLHCSEKHVRAKSQIGKLFQAILILQEEILRSRCKQTPFIRRQKVWEDTDNPTPVGSVWSTTHPDQTPTSALLLKSSLRSRCRLHPLPTPYEELRRPSLFDKPPSSPPCKLLQ